MGIKAFAGQTGVIVIRLGLNLIHTVIDPGDTLHHTATGGVRLCFERGVRGNERDKRFPCFRFHAGTRVRRTRYGLTRGGGNELDVADGDIAAFIVARNELCRGYGSCRDGVRAGFGDGRRGYSRGPFGQLYRTPVLAYEQVLDLDREHIALRIGRIIGETDGYSGAVVGDDDVFE